MQGVGFGGLLAILFIGLKLDHVIDWEWVWVLSPLWIGVALFGALMLIYILVGCSAEGLSNLGYRRRMKKRKAWANR